MLFRSNRCSFCTAAFPSYPFWKTACSIFRKWTLLQLLLSKRILWLSTMFCPRKRFHWITSFLPCLIPRPSGRSFIFFRKNCPVFPFFLLSKKTLPYLFGEPICSLQNSSVFLSPAIPDFLSICPSPSWWRAFLFLTLDG